MATFGSLLYFLSPSSEVWDYPLETGVGFLLPTVVVGAVVCDGEYVPPRGLAVLRALRRHLAPHVADQLSRDRANVEARRTWQVTPREWEVAELAAQGLTNQQIAQRLFVGVDTVKKHLSRVLNETRCTSRTQLAVRWQQQRYLNEERQ